MWFETTSSRPTSPQRKFDLNRVSEPILSRKERESYSRFLTSFNFIQRNVRRILVFRYFAVTFFRMFGVPSHTGYACHWDFTCATKDVDTLWAYGKPNVVQELAFPDRHTALAGLPQYNF